MDSQGLVQEAVRLLKNEDVILFLGAGASVGTRDERGVPSSSELAEAIGAEFGTGSQSGDLTKAASVAAHRRAGVAAVKRFVAERVRDRSRDPLAAHRALARVRPPLIITTNYDDLCEKALEAELGEPPARLLGAEDAVHLPRGRIRVVKLHGDLGHPNSLVLTGEDYLDWESKTEGLFSAVTAEFQHSSCVFVGYSLNDENLRRIIGLVRRRLGDYAPKHYALVREVDEGTADGFGDSVEFVAGDATEFLENLAARWLLEDPGRVDLRAEERNLVEAAGRRDFDAATRSCERLQEEYERRGALNSAAAARRYLAMEAEGAGASVVALGAYAESGRLYRAVAAEVSAEEVFAEARRIARAEGMRAEEQKAEELLQEVRLSGGDYEAVLRETKEALEAAGDDTPTSLLYSLYSKRAAAKEALGDDEGAVAETEEALAALPAEALYLRVRLLADLARIRASLGEWEAAREALDRAEVEIGGSPEAPEGAERRRSKALVDLVRANIHYALGEDREAIALYEGCAEVLEELGEIGLFVSALRGAIASRRAVGEFATPQTRARAADASNAAPEYGRIKDKERQGIAELAQEQFVAARAHLIQGLTEAQSVHAPLSERSLRRWYAEVLRRAEAPVDALQQYVLAGDVKKTRELAAQLAVSPRVELAVLQQLADGLDREASSGGVLNRAAAFAALAALADVLPEAVLPGLTELLAELANSVGSMREHDYIIKEAATMAASVLPLLDRYQALRVAEALVGFIVGEGLFWTTYEEACLGLTSFAGSHAEAVADLDVPVARLVDLVGGDVINDQHKSLLALISLTRAGHADSRRATREVLKSGRSVQDVRYRRAIDDVEEDELAQTIRRALPVCAERVQATGHGHQFGIGAISPFFIRGWTLPEAVKSETARALTEAVADPAVILPHRQQAALVLGEDAPQFAEEDRNGAVDVLMGILASETLEMHPVIRGVVAMGHPLSAMRAQFGSPDDVRAAAAKSALAFSPWMGEEQRRRLMREIETLRASQVKTYGRAVADGLRRFIPQEPQKSEEERWLSARLLLLLNAAQPAVRGLAARTIGRLIRADALPFDAELLDMLVFLGDTGGVEDRVGAAHGLAAAVRSETWDRPEARRSIDRLRTDRSYSVRRAAGQSTIAKSDGEGT